MKNNVTLNIKTVIMALMMVLIMVLIIVMPLKAIAAELDKAPVSTLERSDDYSEIKKLIPEMKKWAADDNLTDVEITDDDLSRTYCIYTDFNPAQIKDNHLDTIEKYLSSSDYIWEVPVDISGKIYTYTIGKGMPLSENGKNNLSKADQTEIEKSEGKFKIYSFGEGEDIYSSVKKITASKDYDQIFVVGGIPGYRSSYMLGIKNGSANAFIPLSDTKSQKTVSWNDMRTAVKKAAAAESTQDEVSGVQNGTETEKQTISDFHIRYMLVTLACVALIFVIMTAIIRKRSH
ncbi:MAG: hypothetical protein ACI4CX_10200 [Candidatus Weimeria sp.]